MLKMNLYTKNTGTVRLFLFTLLVLILSSAPLLAQTARRIETLLAKPALNWEDAAVFTLEAADRAVLSDPSDPKEAFDYAYSRNWLPQRAQMGGAARLDGVALLFMRAFDLKGGFFYTITKNSHYAYRELVYKEVIQGRTEPNMAVSGEDYLFMLGRILSEEEPRRQAEHETLATEIKKLLAGIADISVEVIAEGVTIRLFDIQFDADSSVLTEQAKAKLREVTSALKIKSIQGKRVLISGHTAMAGVVSNQQRISLERAQAAAAYLAELGFRREDQIMVRGYGANRPIADNSTPEGMAKNRRVEITILDN